MGDSTKRKLRVTGQKPLTTVQTGAGGESTLYEVFATDPDGTIIEEQLRSFAELEEGVVIEYDVKRYNHPKYGTSFTLTPPKRNSAKRLRELEEQLDALVFWAKKQGFDLEKSKRELATEIAMTKKSEAPERPDLDERFGLNAPWDDEDLENKPEES